MSERLPSLASLVGGGDVARSERLDELLNGQACLFDQAPECAGLQRPVLGNDDGEAAAAEDEVGAGLAQTLKSESLERARGFGSGDVAGEFHTRAKTGSSTKWRRMRAGCSPGSKYPFTASAIMAWSSASVSPCVVMPPPRGSSHRATNPRVSGQASTRNVTSFMPSICQRAPGIARVGTERGGSGNAAGRGSFSVERGGGHCQRRAT